MKRLLIFCFYNHNGLVGDYVLSLLSQLYELVERTVFVVNGSITENGRLSVGKYTDEIIVRENIGLDYGAYRCAIIDIIGRDELRKYDELILCNDTFFGFFTPIGEIFSEMERRNTDIWGLNRIERGLLDCIQSYFLVFNNSVITSDLVWEYFYDNPVLDNSYGETAAFLETKLFRWFTLHNMSLDSYVFTESYSIYSSPYKCIADYCLPIMKRKCFNKHVVSYSEIRKIINYLGKSHLFDITLLEQEQISKLQVKPRCMKFFYPAQVSEADLIEFGEEIFYIFGYGVQAKELFLTYFANNENFMGFVVSFVDDICENVYSISEIPFDSRVIIGVNAETQEEVNALIPDTMERLLIWDTKLV